MKSPWLRKDLGEGGGYPVFLASAFISATLALKAKLVVELGTGPGFSAGGFLTALRLTGGVLYSIDSNPEWEKITDKLKDYKDIFYFILGDSIEIGRRWDKGNIDILYCDSGHNYEHVLGECEMWGKFNPKIIFIHDTLDNNSKIGPYLTAFHAGKKYAEKHGRIFFNFTVPQGLGVIV